MSYKVVDIYKDLPRTNCGECGRGSCFSFATAVYLESFPLDRCPHLDEPHRSRMEERLGEGRAEGGAPRPPATEQALRSLLAEVASADLRRLAAVGDCLHSAEPEEAVVVPFLGEEYRVSRGDVVSVRGEAPTVWVKILLLIYLTRSACHAEPVLSRGGPAAGERWVSYRDLPNTVSKHRTFEACAEGVAAGLSGRGDVLRARLLDLGAREVDAGPADAAFQTEVLPRVPFRILFWEAEEEFAARVTFLLSPDVLDHLDQEALVFAAEALAARLLGRPLADVVG